MSDAPGLRTSDGPGLAVVPAAQRSLLRPMPPAASLEPQLARSTDAPPVRGSWLHERKLDGIRITAHVRGGRVRLLTRTGNDRASDFPEVIAAVARLGDDVIVDGELVATVDGRESPPALLRRRPHGPGAAEQGAEVRLHLFDLLALAGHDLRDLPLVTRKEVLAALPLAAPVELVAHRLGPVDLAAACAAGWEGLMLKCTDAPYRSGRSHTWLKLTCHREGRFVVGGWTPARGSQGSLGALVVGYRLGEQLRYAGRVGSGLPEATGRVVETHLREIERSASPFVDAPVDREVRWVVPHLVVDVVFAGWTEAGRLRHARFIATRTDLTPDEATGEAPSPQATAGSAT